MDVVLTVRGDNPTGWSQVWNWLLQAPRGHTLIVIDRPLTRWERELEAIGCLPEDNEILLAA
jgi:hypothetical protein